MRNLTRATSLVLAAAALAACADQPTTPALAGGPRLASAAACAAAPAAVVSTEAGLRAAVAAAQAGDVIAISGTIPLAESVILATPGITLTCAEPGAGLALGTGNLFALLELDAGHITISGLELDAEYGFSAVLAANIFGGDFSGIRFIGNEVECGYTTCVFFVGTKGTVVTDNHFKGDSTNTGIQFQAPGRLADGTPISPVDDAVISRNLIETSESYPNGIYGAIRVRDGSNATISHNDIRAGWTNGIALTNVYDSRVDQNLIDGALYYGLDVPQIVARPIALARVSFTGNRISNSGRSAMWPGRACYNTFTGNNVQDNDRGAVFLASTGANVWRGNPGEVEDRGSFDCDGDGVVDPNQISGARANASATAAPAFSASAAPAPGGGNGRYPELL
ncbi:MAG TPA: right-handed parallel beta-helix repeat-containing protein [Longimicrobium sp.]|nr:right-handed parallel beta-helix repeat-containing protein [Longimicrobium sp.]